MNKYEILVNVLDQLRKEAPSLNKRYFPSDTDTEKLNQARSRAYIHLYLKVIFGLTEFSDREHLITDDKNDGGVDAYYIDTRTRTIFFIQSKFRVNSNNFENKEIAFDELLNIDIDRISQGEDKNDLGIEYNGKIKQLQREINQVADIARYSYVVIILANFREKNQSKLRKLTGGYASVEVFNFERTYKELLFPIITGTYYNHEDLKIHINLSNKLSSNARISYRVETEHEDCIISLLFVPTLEIAKVMYLYKNSILKYNPRCYLELAGSSVNKEIERTIIKKQTNEFSLFNNGITMLSYGTEFSESTGKRDIAQLIVNKPQIINGGQTAFTLSRVYEDVINDPEEINRRFNNKEVLLKLITFTPKSGPEGISELKLIEAISKATNQQTAVDEADRRSNDSVQVELQRLIYEEYGYFYERKKGEFSDGVKAGYINRSQIINRELFLRICKTCDIKPSEARRNSYKILFRENNFVTTLNNSNRYKEYFSGYYCYELLNEIEKRYKKAGNSVFGIATYGNAFRYGKFAVVSACMLSFTPELTLDDLDVIVNSVLKTWKDFEEKVSNLSSNSIYFMRYYDSEKDTTYQELNFDNYYKGRNSDNDIKKYFLNKF
ncbi:AIPR family protein [Larkinella sp. GY13]|uniref:AIPR family protein n=1 Tax=Larkinella sp. GY13 TaxID=3453720 RepID=UPI003EE91110